MATELIARLFLDQSNYERREATEAILSDNSSRCNAPVSASSPPQLLRQTYGNRARQPTESPEPETPWAGLIDPHLVLSFSHMPSTQHGFVFGRDTRADIMLPEDLKGISYHHCAITFSKNFPDGRYRLVIRDLGSLTGTSVDYNDVKTEKRSNFVWILDPDMRNIVIRLHKDIVFRVEVVIKDTESPAQLRRIGQFLRPRSPEALLDALQLDTGRTTRATGSHTPKTGPILVKLKTLGQGSFGSVSRSWNVSTGVSYAVKEPSELAKATRNFDTEAWRNEGQTLIKLKHEHIVKTFSWQLEPPEILFEFIPGRSLDKLMDMDEQPFDHDQSVRLTRQCLSALVYLHKIPLAHRDIKPANILVAKKDGKMHVKLSDFGTCRENDELLTFCGTRTYMAPEIFELRNLPKKDRQHYSLLVDIWSLGVVAYQCVWALPQPFEDGVGWCKTIEEDVGQNTLPNIRPLSTFLAKHMLVVDPRSRSSAQVCFDALLKFAPTSRASTQAAGPRPAQQPVSRWSTSSESSYTTTTQSQSSRAPVTQVRASPRTIADERAQETIRQSIETNDVQETTVKARQHPRSGSPLASSVVKRQRP